MILISYRNYDHRFKFKKHFGYYKQDEISIQISIQFSFQTQQQGTGSCGE